MFLELRHRQSRDGISCSLLDADLGPERISHCLVRFTVRGDEIDLGQPFIVSALSRQAIITGCRENHAPAYAMADRFELSPIPSEGKSLVHVPASSAVDRRGDFCHLGVGPLEPTVCESANPSSH